MSPKPQPQEYTEAQVTVMRALGMCINEETREVSCSGRPGVVYLRHEGAVVPLAHSAKTHKPVQVSCEHAAMELINDFYRVLLTTGVEHIMNDKPLPHVPDPQDFLYVFSDEEPELEVTSTTDADTLISHIKEAL